MTDTGDKELEPVPKTEDGIPLFANGRKLTDKEIEILREARARRDAIDARADVPKEVNGGDRKAEPTRYGDWEKGGRAYDFS
ncbi:DUF1674 domain-containing protein [Parvularcula lutaonensis]|uniref:DUF1674 domain-containing protein n=1 Tax=Parvularcula lutaonensis TaxID=491923 RepID=A0ABV7M963_9PROT|nr:DUF1674 domain-containing protein [Parvularcula lutaonensis]GGY46556.1 hypothetical protein GCM10007148_14580 [Parvularcula lutaonensis]